MSVQRRGAPVGRGAGALAVLVLVVGCSGGGSGHGAAPTPSGPVATTSASLDAANTAFAAARDALPSSIVAITKGASVLDAIDAVAIKGDKGRTTSAVPGAVGPVAAATKALSGLTRQINAYAQAVQQLAGAERTPGLTPGQVQALATLVAAANAEVAALRSLEGSQSTGWPAYNQLQSAQALWQMRVSNAFFGAAGGYDARAAGEAYAAMTHPLRSLLATERASLAGGTGKLSAARAVTARALDGANKAFS